MSASPFFLGLGKLTQYQEGRSRRATSGVYYPDRHDDISNNFDREDVIPPGQTFVLADLSGPGVINHIWLTFLHEPHRWTQESGAANHQEILLRMFWDGRPEPDVEAPVGEFFASCFGKRMEVISLPVVVGGGAGYNCYWQMPFRKAARIEVVNQSNKPIRKLYFNIDWTELPELPENTLYFCARYRQEYPAESGKDYLVLETEGKGCYVGTVLGVRTRSPAWFGEGDELIYIDGESFPSIRGTGTEDYFCSAWGLRKHLTPYFGVPHINHPLRIIGQETCSYRWHIEDPILFSQSIKVTFETYGWISPDENKENKAHSWNERQDDFSSVAFWYQRSPSRKFAPTYTAEERKLPCLDRFIAWAKDYIGDEHHGRGAVELVEGAEYLEAGGQLVLSPESQREGWIEIPITVQKKEPLRLLVELSRGPDHGLYQPSLDGVQLGDPIDLYSEKPHLLEDHLLDFWPEPGRYVFRLECVGKNPISRGERLGIYSVRLRERRPRVEAFGYEKDWNWRENPHWYR
ncbi:DUF2961 domain-containing protein [bacterium]|nr:DUF2961 domain-containing protein [bacterium]